MANKIGVLFIFSLLLIFGNSKPLKRKHRESDDDLKIEEKIEETISEEKNETLVTVLTKFNDFYTDILPELKLTISQDCNDDDEKVNTTTPKHELSLASSLECLTLDASACAASLKKQFNQKVKEEYVREISSFIIKTFDMYAAILKELPSNDPHENGIQKFLNLLNEDLPKLTTALELEMLDKIFNAMQNNLKPQFNDETKIDDESKKLYEDLFQKFNEKRPTVESLNEKKIAYVNKIWNELIADLRELELFKSL